MDILALVLDSGLAAGVLWVLWQFMRDNRHREELRAEAEKRHDDEQKAEREIQMMLIENATKLQAATNVVLKELGENQKTMNVVLTEIQTSQVRAYTDYQTAVNGHNLTLASVERTIISFTDAIQKLDKSNEIQQQGWLAVVTDITELMGFIKSDTIPLLTAFAEQNNAIQDRLRDNQPRFDTMQQGIDQLIAASDQLITASQEQTRHIIEVKNALLQAASAEKKDTA